MIYTPLKVERNFVRLDSLQNRIIEEKHTDSIPLYARLRDYLVTDEVKNLFLIRHTQTEYNMEDRIGGDPGLTAKGREQAEALGQFFAKKKISYIFTSSKLQNKTNSGSHLPEHRMIAGLSRSKSLMKSMPASAKA